VIKAKKEEKEMFIEFKKSEVVEEPDEKVQGVTIIKFR
jgi:hypothetical protein